MMIRKMTPSDVAQVAVIEEQCFSLPWSVQGFLDAIKREDTVFLVAAEGEKILGYIGMYTSFGEGEITNVAVSGECRKQGIGESLVESIQFTAREMNLDSIVLEVRASNESAIALYKKKGFAKLGIRKNFYEKPTEDAWIMSYRIGAKND